MFITEVTIDQGGTTRKMNIPRCVLLIRTAFLLICLRMEPLCVKTSSIPADCSVGAQILGCAYSVPQHIPRGVTKVYIRGYNQTTPISIGDGHTGWESVVELDITIDKSVEPYHFTDNAFNALKTLKTLGIHGRYVTQLGKYTFAGLDSLEELDLSGCMYLSFQDVIIPAIRGTALPKISSLNLAEVETSNADKMVVNNDAVDMIIDKSITKLNLSSTNVLLRDINYNRPLPVQYLDMSNVTMMELHDVFGNISTMLANIKTIILSDNARYNMVELYYINEHRTGCDATFILRNIMIEQFYGNKVSTNPITIRNSTLDFTACPFDSVSSLKLVHAQYNHIVELDVVLTLPENNLTEVDFSHNNIKYISPMLLKDTTSLRYFFLAYNNLHFMEYKPEFANLLTNLTNLEEISIAYNHLTIIPRALFSKNMKLRIIDLSGNDLETVNFEVGHLKHLKLISLKGNRIKSLSELFRTGLSSLIDTRNNDTIVGNIELNLEDNAIECSCATKAFISWILQYIQPTAKRPYSCMMDGKVEQISKHSLKEIEYVCIRTTVIIASVVSSCIFIALVIFAIICIVRSFRLRRKQTMRQTYLDAFRDGTLFHGNTQVKYVTFLAHSSADVAVVSRVIFHRLNDAFKEMIGVNSDTVCVGDRHFLPGFSIIDQTLQCMDQSCAAIVVVSESFCRSPWCELELKAAYEQHKPIVLIFTETVDENLMSPILLNIFRRQTRATLYHQYDQYVLEPSWHVLCEAVVMLTSIHHQNDRGEAEVTL